jgi:hypothetical protein
MNRIARVGVALFYIHLSLGRIFMKWNRLAIIVKSVVWEIFPSCGCGLRIIMKSGNPSKIRGCHSSYRRITSTKSPSFCMTAFSASLKPYGPPTSVTWLQLLPKQTNTDTSTAMITERLTSHSPDMWHKPRLANVTCGRRWTLRGINPAILLDVSTAWNGLEKESYCMVRIWWRGYNGLFEGICWYSCRNSNSVSPELKPAVLLLH